MRNISEDALTKLSTRQGTEPIIMVDVAWIKGGSPVIYAERSIASKPNVQGKILEVSNLDNLINVASNESNAQVTVTLDDTDGSIKEIINNNDVHLRDVSLYQWFEGLDFDDRFLIFKGKINSPIVWSESERTFTFDVLSQVEDTEIGFSPEEGEFPDLPIELIGKPWPECFGTAVHSKTVQLDHKHAGTLAEPVGIADFTLQARIDAIGSIMNALSELIIFFAIAEGYLRFIGAKQAADAMQQKQIQAVNQRIGFTQQRLDLIDVLAAQEATERSSFRVIQGETFPRGTITLDISGAKFRGSFSGDRFRVSKATHPDRDQWPEIAGLVGGSGSALISGSGSNAKKVFPYAETFGGRHSGQIIGDQAGPFFADGGASVTIASNEPIRYVASITPGTVLGVAAYATLESGQKILMDLPSDDFTVSTKTYGSITATIVTLKDALSKKKNRGFEDTIYVTFRSDIGPNPVDIIEYLITTYTDFSTDTESFDHVRARLRNYPMHFCYLTRKNILQALQELTFQARSSIFLKNETFFLRYLPEQPSQVETFDESTISLETMELYHSDTEELITKFTGTWRSHGAQELDNTILLRYNVAKYGIHEKSFDFYAYSNSDIIIKVMTYWLIRLGHTWKKLRFSTALDKLKVEVFDGVRLKFTTNYVANIPVLGCVEKADYNSETKELDFEVWTPVRAGEMLPYDFAYPGDVDVTLRFPTQEDEDAGNLGSGGKGSNANGNINQRGSQSNGINVQYNGEVDPFGFGDRARQDKGDPTPSDQDDKDPGVPDRNAASGVTFGTGPPSTPALTDSQIDEFEDPFFIDIRTTEITDSQSPGAVATLDSFFKAVKGDKLQGNTEAIWSDGDAECPFDFKKDPEGEKFGAGTAFLQDE